jgi:glycosyltransferase involved in cell wall biosynthesis
MNQPSVSVILSTRNNELYIEEAIESILNQTFIDFEFLIADDGSTDNTVEKLIKLSQRDERIKLSIFNKNSGLPYRLNNLIKKSAGKYIARMDGDDISLPNRLMRQVQFLEANPDYGLVGTFVQLIGIANHKIWEYPISHDEIVSHMLFYNCFAHPSVMLNKNLIRHHNLFYNTQLAKIQDYDLWVRCSRKFKVANIPEVLLNYRLEIEDIKNKYWKEDYQHVIQLIREAQLNELKVDYSSTDLNLHNRLSNNKIERNKMFLLKTKSWFDRLQKANTHAGIFPEPAFSNLLLEKYSNIKSTINMSMVKRFKLQAIYLLGRLKIKFF